MNLIKQYEIFIEVDFHPSYWGLEMATFARRQEAQIAMTVQSGI